MSSIARAAACNAPRMPTKPWISEFEFVMDGLHAGRRQAVGIGLALVAQRIEARRVDQRRRQAGEIVGLATARRADRPISLGSLR